MRVVFDTNILLAAFLTEGLCAKLLSRARKGELQLVLCPCLVNEFKRTLTRKFKATSEETAVAMTLLSEAAVGTVEPTGTLRSVCRDKDDDHVLACAMAAGAEYLVTGDSDLLELQIFEGVCIIKPRDFESMM